MSEIKQLQDDLDDLKNVEDADEDVSTTGELFSISSFGVDYPVETLVSRMEKSFSTYRLFSALLCGPKISALDL